jgi:hypothetical protein
MEEQYRELINKQIDGLNDASESEELQRSLATDKEARGIYDDLLRMANALKRVEAIEPPSRLKTQILNSIRSGPASTESRSSRLSVLLEVFRRRPLARYSLVFASGLCVGVLFFVFANPWRQGTTADSSKVGGAMALLPDLSRLPVVDSARIESEGIEGTFRTFRNEGNVLVEIALNSSVNVRVEMNSDPSELTFGGISRLSGTEGLVSVTQGKIVLTDVKSDLVAVAFSSVGEIHRAVEVRIYKGDVIVQSVFVRAH